MAWSAPVVVEKGMIYWVHRLISRAFSGRLYKDFFGRAFEIFEEGRTQPSFHFPLWPAIPIASAFGSSPNESGGVAWKISQFSGKYWKETKRFTDETHNVLDPFERQYVSANCYLKIFTYISYVLYPAGILIGILGQVAGVKPPGGE
jgi:hypothetical protein